MCGLKIGVKMEKINRLLLVLLLFHITFIMGRVEEEKYQAAAVGIAKQKDVAKKAAVFEALKLQEEQQLDSQEFPKQRESIFFPDKKSPVETGVDIDELIAIFEGPAVEGDGEVVGAGFWTSLWGGITKPVKWVSDAGNYTVEFFTREGFNSTRTLNAAIARLRDTVKTGYFLTGSFDGFEKKKNELNNPGPGGSTILKALYIAHKSKMGKHAQVRTSSDLCPREKRFIEGREAHIKRKASEIFAGNDEDFNKVRAFFTEKNEVPHGGMIFSGGGFRAMFAAQGVIKGMEETGLIHLMTHSAGLSGGTWGSVVWAMGKTIDAASESAVKYAKYNKIKKNPEEYLTPQKKPTEHNKFDEVSVMNDNMLRQFYWSQPMDSILNFYGPRIGHLVLSSFDDPTIDKYSADDVVPLEQSRQRVLLSQGVLALEADNFGARPLFLGTACSPLFTLSAKQAQSSTTSALQWFEFSPYEIGTVYKNKSGQDVGGFVETWAFGRKFEPLYEESKSFWEMIGLKTKKSDGYGSVDNAPELPLGGLMGIWGSAYTVSSRDAARIAGGDVILEGGNDGWTNPLTIVKRLMDLIATYALGSASFFKNTRVFPGTVHNFMKDLPDTPLDTRTISLIDGGIDFNLPFPPLLRKERSVSYMIVLDASGPVFKKDKHGVMLPSELLKSEKWARSQNIPFPAIEGSNELETASVEDVTVWIGEKGEPMIVYIPLMDNSVSEGVDFKPSKCAEDDCATLNFNYTEENSRGLINHTYMTVMKNADKIKKAIAQKILQS